MIDNFLLREIFGKSINIQALETFGAVTAIIIVGVVLLVAVCTYLWHIKENGDLNTFTVTKDGLSEQSEKIAAVLQKMKASKREIMNTLLLLEEVVVRLQEHAGQTVTARVRKFLGDVQISLASHGEAYNPFGEVSIWDTESEDYLRNMIFHSNKEKLSYARRNGKNLVTITAHPAGSRVMYYMSFAMVLGICFGFCIKWLPVTVSTFIADNVLSTVQTLFMNAISLMLAPVLFFSLVSTFSNLTSKNEIGRIGGKIISCFLFTTLIALFLGFLLGRIFYDGNLPSLPKTLSPLSEEYQASGAISVKAILLDIIPRNVVNPISEGNMLQIIFIAILTGIALSALGEKVSTLKAIFSEANELFLKMMGMVIFFMPLVAFASMALLMFSSTASALLILLQHLVVLAIGVVIMFVLYGILFLIIGRTSPVQYFKKTAVYLLTPFMLSSSCACIPMTIDFCKKKLGISNKISSFTIPLGATVNMNGVAIYLLLCAILLIKMCGISMDMAMYFKLGALTLLGAIGASGVPNSGIVVLVMLPSAVGAPIGSISFLLGVWSIMDRFGTVTNVNGDIAAAILVAKSEDELDMAAYKAV